MNAITSILAHGGTAGLAAELFLLSLPLVGFGVLWWWNRRLGRAELEKPDEPPSGGPGSGTAGRP